MARMTKLRAKQQATYWKFLEPVLLTKTENGAEVQECKLWCGWQGAERRSSKLYCRSLCSCFWGLCQPSSATSVMCLLSTRCKRMEVYSSSPQHIAILARAHEQQVPPHQEPLGA